MLDISQFFIYIKTFQLMEPQPSHIRFTLSQTATSSYNKKIEQLFEIIKTLKHPQDLQKHISISMSLLELFQKLIRRHKTSIIGGQIIYKFYLSHQLLTLIDAKNISDVNLKIITLLKPEVKVSELEEIPGSQLVSQGKINWKHLHQNLSEEIYMMNDIEYINQVAIQRLLDAIKHHFDHNSIGFVVEYFKREKRSRKLIKMFTYINHKTDPHHLTTYFDNLLDDYKLRKITGIEFMGQFIQATKYRKLTEQEFLKPTHDLNKAFMQSFTSIHTKKQEEKIVGRYKKINQSSACHLSSLIGKSNPWSAQVLKDVFFMIEREFVPLTGSSDDIRAEIVFLLLFFRNLYKRLNIEDGYRRKERKDPLNQQYQQKIEESLQEQQTIIWLSKAGIKQQVSDHRFVKSQLQTGGEQEKKQKLEKLLNNEIDTNIKQQIKQILTTKLLSKLFYCLSSGVCYVLRYIYLIFPDLANQSISYAWKYKNIQQINKNDLIEKVMVGIPYMLVDFSNRFRNKEWKHSKQGLENLMKALTIIDQNTQQHLQELIMKAVCEIASVLPVLYKKNEQKDDFSNIPQQHKQDFFQIFGIQHDAFYGEYSERVLRILTSFFQMNIKADSALVDGIIQLYCHSHSNMQIKIIEEAIKVLLDKSKEIITAMSLQEPVQKVIVIEILSRFPFCVEKLKEQLEDNQKDSKPYLNILFVLASKISLPELEEYRRHNTQVNKKIRHIIKQFIKSMLTPPITDQPLPTNLENLHAKFHSLSKPIDIQVCHEKLKELWEYRDSIFSQLKQQKYLHKFLPLLQIICQITLSTSLYSDIKRQAKNFLEYLKQIFTKKNLRSMPGVGDLLQQLMSYNRYFSYEQIKKSAPAVQQYEIHGYNNFRYKSFQIYQSTLNKSDIIYASLCQKGWPFPEDSIKKYIFKPMVLCSNIESEHMLQLFKGKNQLQLLKRLILEYMEKALEMKPEESQTEEVNPQETIEKRPKRTNKILKILDYLGKQMVIFSTEEIKQIVNYYEKTLSDPPCQLIKHSSLLKILLAIISYSTFNQELHEFIFEYVSNSKKSENKMQHLGFTYAITILNGMVFKTADEAMARETLEFFIEKIRKYFLSDQYVLRRLSIPISILIKKLKNLNTIFEKQKFGGQIDCQSMENFMKFGFARKQLQNEEVFDKKKHMWSLHEDYMIQNNKEFRERDFFSELTISQKNAQRFINKFKDDKSETNGQDQMKILQKSQPFEGLSRYLNLTSEGFPSNWNDIQEREIDKVRVFYHFFNFLCFQDSKKGFNFFQAFYKKFKQSSVSLGQDQQLMILYSVNLLDAYQSLTGNPQQNVYKEIEEFLKKLFQQFIETGSQSSQVFRKMIDLLSSLNLKRDRVKFLRDMLKDDYLAKNKYVCKVSEILIILEANIATPKQTVLYILDKNQNLDFSSSSKLLDNVLSLPQNYSLFQEDLSKLVDIPKALKDNLVEQLSSRCYLLDNQQIHHKLIKYIQHLTDCNSDKVSAYTALKLLKSIFRNILSITMRPQVLKLLKDAIQIFIKISQEQYEFQLQNFDEAVGQFSNVLHLKYPRKQFKQLIDFIFELISGGGKKVKKILQALVFSFNNYYDMDENQSRQIVSKFLRIQFKSLFKEEMEILPNIISHCQITNQQMDMIINEIQNQRKRIKAYQAYCLAYPFDGNKDYIIKSVKGENGKVWADLIKAKRGKQRQLDDKQKTEIWKPIYQSVSSWNYST